MYTVDTNIVIYHANGDQAAHDFLFSQFEQDTPCFLSTISVVEFFSFAALTADAKKAFALLFPYFRIVVVDYSLSLAAAKLRRNYALKLGDAVIAATAILTSSTITTRNVRDFRKIPGLPILAV